MSTLFKCRNQINTYKVLEINEAITKTTTKIWLAKAATIFIHKTGLACYNACNRDKTSSFSEIGDFVSL